MPRRSLYQREPEEPAGPEPEPPAPPTGPQPRPVPKGPLGSLRGGKPPGGPPEGPPQAGPPPQQPPAAGPPEPTQVAPEPAPEKPPKAPKPTPEPAAAKPYEPPPGFRPPSDPKYFEKEFQKLNRTMNSGIALEEISKLISAYDHYRDLLRSQERTPQQENQLQMATARLSDSEQLMIRLLEANAPKGGRSPQFFENLINSLLMTSRRFDEQRKRMTSEDWKNRESDAYHNYKNLEFNYKQLEDKVHDYLMYGREGTEGAAVAAERAAAQPLGRERVTGRDAVDLMNALSDAGNKLMSVYGKKGHVYTDALEQQSRAWRAIEETLRQNPALTGRQVEDVLGQYYRADEAYRHTLKDRGKSREANVDYERAKEARTDATIDLHRMLMKDRDPQTGLLRGGQ